MKISSRIGSALRRARNSHVHLAERLKVLFAASLEHRRRDAGLSYSEVAARVEASPAYISKVFRGDSNLTIESMAKLAVATGSDLEIRLVDAEISASTWSIARAIALAPGDARTTPTSTAVTVGSFGAANSEKFACVA